MASKELFSLGAIYPSDFLKPDEQPRCEPVELKLIMDESGMVRLENSAPKECMYGKYWYRSGINDAMRHELKDIVDSILKVFKVDGVWLDIASNDGTLLSFVPSTTFKVGFDPADDSYSKECKKYAHVVIQDFFSLKKYKEIGSIRKASVVTSIAMFYDLENPEQFIEDVYDVLDDDGLWVLQLSYSPLMLLQLAFDNICHEHIFYYSLQNIKQLFNKNNFQILDCQLNETNGGSFRIYCMKDIGDITKFGSRPYRDVCQYRVNSILVAENNVQPSRAITWGLFFDKVNVLKQQLVSFIQTEKAKGKTIMAYGASTKGNTLLQFFGLDNSLITAIADRSEYKHGLRTVGTNIPIISEEEMRKAQPDYLLILPWHFIQTFKEREKEYLKNGGHFIVPMPRFEIIGL